MSEKRLKIAFDIGGVISRYPQEMLNLMQSLQKGGVDIHIITDMNQKDALSACRENNINFLPEENIHSADWSAHGDCCKTVVCDKLGIDILLDDRPDYCADGNFIGFVLSPRVRKPYYAPGWVNRSTPVVCVPPEEYDEFKAWREQKASKKASDECDNCGIEACRTLSQQLVICTICQKKLCDKCLKSNHKCL